MTSNRRKLNADKTEFIWLGTRQQLAKITLSVLQLKDQILTPLKKIRSLGIVFDGELEMDAHAGNVVQTCFYQLRQLRSVRRSLTLDARRTHAAAFISSRVDYCNAVVFYGVSSQVTRRLQMVLNADARLVVSAGKYDHITLAIRDVLHWLPVPQRILFKMAFTAFDSIRGTGPAYFKDVCISVSDVSGRPNFRSVWRGNMFVPRTRTLLGRRSFRIAVPLIGNSLPEDMRSVTISREQFRARLKTQLFSQA